MFAVVLPGRPCLTEFVTVSPTQFAFSFPSVPHFSHIVVFMLPGSVLPPNTAAGVYAQLPVSRAGPEAGGYYQQQQQPQYKLLGAIGNEKPSAIFKVNLPDSNAGGVGGGGDIAEATVNLGISVEPAASIQAQLAALQQQQQQQAEFSPTSPGALVKLSNNSNPPASVSTKKLAQRIIGNAFNFLASFAGTAGPGGQEVIPLKSFQDWWVKFERRVENDPGFLERDDL